MHDLLPPLPADQDGLPPGYRVLDPDDPDSQRGPWRNRLACAASPYLRQHATNPVDWRPWSPAIFDEARALDRPVFLSIGYAACHWCHVMERESFRSPAIAALLNGLYLPVKVDREEHPAVDGLYMQALVQATGQGGWPASLWLDHDGVPFQAGTYYPSFYRYGTPAFGDVLRRAAETWTSGRRSVEHFTATLVDALRPPSTAGELDGPVALAAGLDHLEQDWDARDHGWGMGAKFPHSPRLELLLELAEAGQGLPARRLGQALGALERGGVHDHVGGGFHRYAVDSDWCVPHFEKMLYDNAQLARVFARSWRLTGDSRWLRTAGTTLEWMCRDLGRGDGAFASSLDAEAGEDGVEGEPYTWTREQLLRAVGPTRARALAAAYGVEEHPTWEGPGCVLCRQQGDGSLLAGSRRALLAFRDGRAQPARDDKVVVAWNGMAASALAEVGRLAEHGPWLARAEALGDLLLASRLRDGSLPRLLGGGETGVLEDQAQVLESLLDLHRATGLARFLVAAVELARATLERFAASDDGGLLQAPADQPGLFLRRVAWEDGAEPSGCALALLQLVRLQALEARVCSEERLRALLAGAAPFLDRHPHGLPTTLRVLHRMGRPPETIVVGGEQPADLHAAVRRRAPTAVEVVVLGEGLPPLGCTEGKSGEGPARAWRCEGTSCGLPARTPQAVAAWWR